MTDATLPLEAERYLRRLEVEAADLPPRERQRLLAQIREHLADALDDDADVASVLLRLGDPSELAAAAAPAPPTSSASPTSLASPSAPEVAAPRSPLLVAALVVGSVFVVLGGLALLSGLAMFAMTGSPRSTLFPALAVLLLPVGIGLLLPVRRALRRRS